MQNLQVAVRNQGDDGNNYGQLFISACWISYTLMSVSGLATPGIMEWSLVSQFEFLVFIGHEIFIVLTIIKMLINSLITCACPVIVNAVILLILTLAFFS